MSKKDTTVKTEKETKSAKKVEEPKKVEEAKPDFHAQISATRKTYRYTILNRDYPSALHSRTAHYIAIPTLNVTAMRKAARCLVGKHDFRISISLYQRVINEIESL